MILGKFKKENLNSLQNFKFFEVINDYNVIPLEDFLDLFGKETQKYKDLRNAIKLLDIIKISQDIIKSNSKLIKHLSESILSIKSILNYNFLIYKKNLLMKEQKFADIKKITGHLTAKTDLLNKLNKNLEKNKQKLNYTKEDYLYLKNQRDQILNRINTYQQNIEALNNNKRDCFTQINQITRELSSASQTTKNDFNLEFDTTETSSKANLIKNLQNKAKEIQYEITQLNLKVEAANLELEKITPNYQTLERDYKSLQTSIMDDEDQVIAIQNELNTSFNKNEEFKEFDIAEITSLRSKQEIKNEINQINHELDNIKTTNHYLDTQHPQNLSNITKEFDEINHSLNQNTKDMLISYTEDQIIDYIEKFREIEVIFDRIEHIMNKFLVEINIEATFQILINDAFQKFLVHLKFFRSKKEHLHFEGLTTPEKIFFIISLYLSLKIILDTKNIIFSNLFIPNEYNKRGSVFRTINKILPIFEKESYLKDFNLVFIISHLEMKNKIENLNIIKIEEN